MNMFYKFTKASFFLGGKLLVASETIEEEDSELSLGQGAASVNGRLLGSGACGNAKQGKAAVAAAAGMVENSTIMIPALQHRRNLSAFNWNRGQGYDKTSNKLVALPPNDAQKNGTANGETSAELGEKADMQFGYQLRRSGKGLEDLKGMLEDHEIDFPNCSYEDYDEFEEYDSNKLETIWEEDEDDEDAVAFF